MIFVQDSQSFRHYELVSKFNFCLKTFFRHDLLESTFYGDLVYKFKKIVGGSEFYGQNTLQMYMLQFKCDATDGMLSF